MPLISTQSPLILRDDRSLKTLAAQIAAYLAADAHLNDAGLTAIIQLDQPT
jgi:hypothetical protein